MYKKTTTKAYWLSLKTHAKLVKNVMFLAMYFMPLISNSQNLVMDFYGAVSHDSIPIMVGDTLNDKTKLVFENNAEVKLLTEKGVCLVTFNDYIKHPNFGLSDLVEIALRHTSISMHVNIATRSIKSPEEDQLSLVDALCKKLNTDSNKINDHFNNFIVPYCIAKFQNPSWMAIYKRLHDKYGLEIVMRTSDETILGKLEIIPKLANVRSIVQLPSTKSLKQYCPRAGNQGNLPTCSGWASAYGARTISWAIINGFSNPTDVTNNAFSPTFVYELAKPPTDNNCSIGIDVANASKILSKNGDVYKSKVKDKCGVKVNPFMVEAKNYKIKDYCSLWEGRSFDNINIIKKALVENHPVLACIVCHKSFFDTSSFDKDVWSGVLNKNWETDPFVNYHALCIIGYDDKKYGGAVEVLNSWSTIWGKSGFMWIKYPDLKNILRKAIQFYDDSLIQQKNTTPSDTFNRLEGSITLKLSNGKNELDMPAEASVHVLKGNVMKNISRGLLSNPPDNFTYSLIKSYKSGEKFRMYCTFRHPVYVYVFTSDNHSSGYSILFPDSVINESPYLDFQQEVEMPIPDPTTPSFIFDNIPGEDYFCVIFSKQPIDINKIKQQMPPIENNNGFINMVSKAIGDNLANDSDVHFETKRIAFKARSKNKIAVPIFIKITHQSDSIIKKSL